MYCFSSTNDSDSLRFSIVLSDTAKEFLRNLGMMECRRPGVVTNLGLSVLAIEDLLDLGLEILELVLCIGRPLVINPESAKFDFLFSCVGVSTMSALKSSSFSGPPEDVVEGVDVKCPEHLSPGTPAMSEDLRLTVMRFLCYGNMALIINDFIHGKQISHEYTF